jgi:predicted DNA-binding protein
MFAIADRRSRTLHAGAEMRPRRWYTDEHAPRARAARVTGELWRYRVLAQRRTNNAAPTLERRLCFTHFEPYSASESHCGTISVSNSFQRQDRIMDTRLTIKLPDDLRRRAKAIATLRGESISDIVRTALEEYLTESIEDAEDVRAIALIEKRIAEGQERVYSHEEVWAELDKLESQAALPD